MCLSDGQWREAYFMQRGDPLFYVDGSNVSEPGPTEAWEYPRVEQRLVCFERLRPQVGLGVEPRLCPLPIRCGLQRGVDPFAGLGFVFDGLAVSGGVALACEGAGGSFPTCGGVSLEDLPFVAVFANACHVTFPLIRCEAGLCDWRFCRSSRVSRRSPVRMPSGCRA